MEKRVKSLTSYKIRRGGRNYLELYADFTVIKGYFQLFRPIPLSVEGGEV